MRFFCKKIIEGVCFMPQSKFEGRIFALITVLIIVLCFVFYCLSIENGGVLNVEPKFASILIPI